MDPPATPTDGNKPVVKLSHPATPKTTAGSSGETFSTPHQPTNSAAGVGVDKTSVIELFNMDSPMKAYQILAQTPIRKSGQKRHQSQRNVAKIIKGEIHNVLSVMRADPRYYSTGSKGRCRFDYEERQNYSSSALYGGTKNRSSFWGGGNADNWKAEGQYSVYSGGNTISSHPILQGLRDLHDLLSVMEVEGSYQRGGSGNSSGAKCPLAAITAVTFVSPFAAAVKSRDVDAKTTGEALSALHKFIVYGFIGGNDSSVNEYAENDHHMPFSSTNESVRESISLVAQCIRDCSFEDRASRENTSKGMFSFRSSGEDVKPKSILAANNETPNDSGNELPSFLTQPRRKKKSTAAGAHSSSAAYSFSASDEDVILKLLSLSVQVLRCPAGRTVLPVRDIVIIFDACLHIAIAAGEANRTLLRSAAADALSHCVIVVFGARERTHARKEHSLSKIQAGSTRPDDSNADDSDDDGWGERDPTTEELAKESMLAKQSPDKGTADQDADGRQADECATHELLEEPSLVPIMHRLAALADPLIHEDDTCILALSGEP